ncbi:MAG: EcsC family protein [Lentimicrobiaceae bacterium]|nr:EcsC family protein [Lentimicrobiaceae bacterium]MCO5264492.1 EcsC family protein [Lentimicrobium sp.]
MTTKPNHSIVLQALDYAFEKAVLGLPGMDTAEDLAKSYLQQKGTLTERVNALIRWQNTKAGSSGFITGVGGFATLPVSIPANLVSVLYFQVRMVAAIAFMGGYDIRDDRVKSLIYICLAGNMAKDILQEIGIRAGSRITASIIGQISEKTIMAINQKIGIQLLTKTSGRGTINIGKAVPLVGGLIGGTFDVFTTNLIGNIARNTFITEE